MAGYFSSAECFLKLKRNIMAFTRNFNCTQPSGSNSIIIVEDTSTGSDILITSRRVYLRTKDNTFLVPSGTSTQYIAWAISLTKISITVLDKDYALDVIVQWLGASNNILYDKTILNGFTSYNESFDLGLSSLLASNAKLFEDNNFFLNKSKLRDALDSGDKAVSRGGDISKAQACYDVGTDLRVSSQYNFNENS